MSHGLVWFLVLAQLPLKQSPNLHFYTDTDTQMKKQKRNTSLSTSWYRDQLSLALGDPHAGRTLSRTARGLP